MSKKKLSYSEQIYKEAYDHLPEDFKAEMKSFLGETGPSLPLPKKSVGSRKQRESP